jgi:hypothetical protein
MASPPGIPGCLRLGNDQDEFRHGSLVVESEIMAEYKHTQFGYFLFFTYCGVFVVMAYLYLVRDYPPVYLTGMILILIVTGLLAALTVRVNGREIKIKFGVGVIRKGFRLDEIATFRVVKNPWYYGWGIRYTPRGWLFGVSGFSAIELEMKDGRFYRIGTDEPNILANALNKALSASTTLYTLSVTASEGGSVTVSPGNGSPIAGTAVTITAIVGTTVTVTANPVDDNHYFRGWSGAPVDGLSTPSVSFEMHDNYALIATFREIPIDDLNDPIDDPIDPGFDDNTSLVG